MRPRHPPAGAAAARPDQIGAMCTKNKTNQTKHRNHNKTGEGIPWLNSSSGSRKKRHRMGQWPELSWWPLLHVLAQRQPGKRVLLGLDREHLLGAVVGSRRLRLDRLSRIGLGGGEDEASSTTGGGMEEEERERVGSGGGGEEEVGEGRGEGEDGERHGLPAGRACGVDRSRL